MKKKYVKPKIVFEDMTLNTAIAGCKAFYVADCEMEYNTPNGTSKPIFTPDGIFVTANTSECAGGAGVCYHVSAENVFTLINAS